MEPEEIWNVPEILSSILFYVGEPGLFNCRLVSPNWKAACDLILHKYSYGRVSFKDSKSLKNFLNSGCDLIASNVTFAFTPNLPIKDKDVEHFLKKYSTKISTLTINQENNQEKIIIRDILGWMSKNIFQAYEQTQIKEEFDENGNNFAGKNKQNDQIYSEKYVKGQQEKVKEDRDCEKEEYVKGQLVNENEIVLDMTLQYPVIIESKSDIAPSCSESKIDPKPELDCAKSELSCTTESDHKTNLNLDPKSQFTLDNKSDLTPQLESHPAPKEIFEKMQSFERIHKELKSEAAVLALDLEYNPNNDPKNSEIPKDTKLNIEGLVESEEVVVVVPEQDKHKVKGQKFELKFVGGGPKVMNPEYLPVPLDPEGYSSFQDFYPYYLGRHFEEKTRRVHIVASTTTLLLILVGILTLHPLTFFIIAFVQRAIATNVAHYAFQKTRVQKPMRYALYSIMGEFRLWWEVATGQRRF